MSSQARWFLNPLFGEQYLNKMLGIQKADLLGLWPLNEGRGITTPAPEFDGSNAAANIYSNSLRDAFSPSAGTVSLWARVSGAAVWTDSATRRCIYLGIDGDNFVFLGRITTDDTVRFLYKAGGTSSQINNSSLSGTTDWFHMALTWDTVADEVKAYINGAQVGSTQTGLGTWAGTLSAGLTAIGSSSGTVPSSVWDGWLAHEAVWTKALTATQVSDLYDAQSIQSSQILATESANLIAYWPLNEITGSTAENAQGDGDRDGSYVNNVTLANATFSASFTADNLEGTAARDATYTGVTLNYASFSDGSPVPLFDGVNDFVNIYTASLIAAFDGDEGTLSMWMKVSGASVWTDGTSRRCIILLADGSNYVVIGKATANSTMAWQHSGSGTLKQVTLGSLSTTGWVHLALTWSKTADQVIAYYQGAQAGSIQTGQGSFSGSPASTNSLIGAAVTTPSNVFDGYLCNVGIWKAALAASKIKALSAP